MMCKPFPSELLSLQFCRLGAWFSSIQLDKLGRKKRILPTWRHFLMRERNQRKAHRCALSWVFPRGNSASKYSCIEGKAPICQCIATFNNPGAPNLSCTCQKELKSRTSPRKWRRGTEWLNFGRSWIAARQQ